MNWRITADVTEFLAAAGPGLQRDPARNTVLLTVAGQVRLDPSRYPGGPDGTPLFGWLDGPPGGAFLVTPPFPLLLGAGTPEAAAELAAPLAVARGGLGLSGVNSTPEAARAFAAAWAAVPGAAARSRVLLRERLYRLGRLVPPVPAPAGAARIAGEADLTLITGWMTAFFAEAGTPDEGDVEVAVRDRLSHQGFTVWQAGGAPVALAGMSRQVAGMTRVGPVYTPPALRGRGYGSAVTAAVTQRALDDGAAEVVLFTDLANPVSNSIYQRMGYQPVEDRVILAFSGA